MLGNYHYYINFYYPDFFSLWLIKAFGISNSEEMANIELFVNFILATLLSTFFTYIVIHILRHLYKIHRKKE